MKKYLLLIVINCTLNISNIGAQTYRILDVNVSKFPIIEANILAYDVNYNTDSLKVDNISVFENSQQLPLIDFKAPKSSIVPASIVILLDISASMVGTRFDMLKKVTKEFISSLPLEISEVAIASFSDDITLNCDFTHNIETLNNSINLLNTAGGTSYDRAFFNPYAGALSIAKQGQYKRVIIFITDGLSDIKQYEATNRANYDSTTVNCLTIGLPITDELIYITNQTGGTYYNELIHENQIKNALEKIYTEVQVNTYGSISWQSNYSCNALNTNIINLGTQKFIIPFQIPDSLVGSINAIPSSLNFSVGTPKIPEFKTVFVRGNNIGVNITSITNTNSALFGFKNENFPIKTDINELKMLEFSFTPKDSIYAIADYTITNLGCPDVTINASSGGVKKIVITSPTVNNNFVRGSTIPITWRGIDKSKSVSFSYQIKGSADWHTIGASTQYKKNWEAPALNETVKIQGQVTNNITLANLLSNPIHIIDDKDFKAAYFSPDGNEMLTVSKNGLAKNWNAETGILNHSFEKLHQGDIVFFPNYNRIVSFSDSTLEVFTNRNGLHMVSLPLGEKKVLSSFTHIHDNELYATLTNYASLYQTLSDFPNGEYIDGTASPQGNYMLARNNSSLTIFKLQPTKKWFAIKLNPNFNKAILHNIKEYLVLLSDSNTSLYNLNTKQLLKEFHNELFVQFTASGIHFITKNDSQIFINELKTGARLFTLPNTCEYTLSKNGKYAAYSINNSLRVTELATQTNVSEKHYKNPKQFQFFPKTNQLVFTHNDSLTILNFDTQYEFINVHAEPNLIKMFDIAPNEKSLLITTQKVVAIWDIKTHFDADTTPWFKIISPQPNVAKALTFPKQYINTSSEKVFANVIKNTTQTLVVIDSIYIEGSNADFTMVSSPRSMYLSAMQSKAVEIRFTPHKVGNVYGTLVVEAANKKYYCNLSGIGISQGFELPTPFIEFPPLLVGLSTDTVIPIVINTGTETLIVNAIEFSPKMNGVFKLEQVLVPKKLNPLDTLWAKVSFNPKMRGRINGFAQLKLGAHDWIKTTDFYGAGEAKHQLVIAGKTIHARTRQVLKSFVTVTELNSGKITQQQATNGQGNFTIKANADLNYSVSAQLSGYFSSSVNVDLTQPQSNDTVFIAIELTPLLESSMVRLNNIFFESGKADLLDISKTEIKRIIQVLKDQPQNKVEIHGHTDNIGEAGSNMILSKERAIAVKKFITANGIEATRIEIKHFGETQPIESNNDELGKKANRRVEVRFIL